MKIFERITKRYALQNYYLRRNFYWSDTLPEILDYWQQHDELPFLYGGDNWPYDAMCERQRRKGVYASQYLPPPTVRRARWRRWPCVISTMTAVSWTPAAVRGSLRAPCSSKACIRRQSSASMPMRSWLIFTNASIPMLPHCECSFMRLTSAARMLFPIRRSRLRSVHLSCNGFPARKTQATDPCCFCRTALSTNNGPNPCRR